MGTEITSQDSCQSICENDSKCSLFVFNKSEGSCYLMEHSLETYASQCPTIARYQQDCGPFTKSCIKPKIVYKTLLTYIHTEQECKDWCDFIRYCEKYEFIDQGEGECWVWLDVKRTNKVCNDVIGAALN